MSKCLAIHARKPTLNNNFAEGHMHNGGDRMELYLNDKELCVSKPRYGEDGVIAGMSFCDKVVPVKKGDWITMSSVYDLTKHPL